MVQDQLLLLNVFEVAQQFMFELKLVVFKLNLKQPVHQYLQLKAMQVQAQVGLMIKYQDLGMRECETQYQDHYQLHYHQISLSQTYLQLKIFLQENALLGPN